jgi:hypothetical protein
MGGRKKVMCRSRIRNALVSLYLQLSGLIAGEDSV